MKTSSYLLCVGMWLAGSLGIAEAAEGWKAGTAKVEITPAGPVWMAGYASRNEPSKGVDHPLYAKALVLSDGQGSTIVWISVEVIGFDREFSARVKGRLKKSHGLEKGAIALFATHTHTGPLMTKDYESHFRERGIDMNSESAKRTIAFRRELEDKLVKVAGDALGRLEPIKAEFGSGRAEFAINRRQKTDRGVIIGVNPQGPTDKSVPVLKVTGADNKILAIVFGYACHNTTLTDKAMHISGDYAGFAAERIEAEHPGATAIFITGCAGDINPEPRGKPELAKAHGLELAQAVEAVLTGPRIDLKGSIRSAYDEPMLAFSGPTDRAVYEQRLTEPGSGRQAHAKRIIALLDSGKKLVTEYPEPVQAFALGDRLTMVALGGEVVSEYALRLKRELATADHPLWVAAYANDVMGYIGSSRIIKEGGYEGMDFFYYTSYPAPLSEKVEETIIKSVHDQVSKLRTQ